MFGVVYLALGTVLIVAIWIGVINLRRSGRNAAWWMMASGITIATLGTISILASYAALFTNKSAASSGGFEMLWIVVSAVSPLGSLLFAIGFAFHGLKNARASERLAELELLTAAMSEELDQLRNSGQKHG